MGSRDDHRLHDVGLPDGASIRGLLVVEPAKGVVVHLHLTSAPDSGALYSRGFEEPRYAELVPPSSTTDIVDPIASPVEPYVYFSQLMLRDGAASWAGLHRVHAGSGVVEELLPAIQRKRGISSILGMSGDGARLFVNWREPVAGEPRVVYQLVAIDLRSLARTKLGDLPAVFA